MRTPANAFLLVMILAIAVLFHVVSTSQAPDHALTQVSE
jgi:hypothetical protein